MTVTTPARHQSVASRVGYLIAAAVTAAVLYLINVSPGWEAVPFLTADTRQLLGLVNASLIVGLAFNLAYALTDPPWLKALGGLVTTGIGLAVLVRIWRVFPFDFDAYSFNWALLTRTVLVVAIVGSAIGIIAQFVTLVRAAARGGR
jgi:hypothetical protein